jgi:signal transduction histidine kinase
MMQLMLIIGVTACFLLGAFTLFHNKRNFAAFLSLVAAGMVGGLLLPSYQNDYYIWVSLITTLVLTIAISYSVLKNSMFDVRFAAIRTLAYILSLAVLFVIYYVVATIVTNLLFEHSSIVDQSTASMLLAFGVLFIFQPIKKFFDRITKNVFYHDTYDSDEFFARLNKTLTTTTDLRSLLERTSHEIATTLRAQQVFFFVEMYGDHYVTAGTDHHNQIPKDDALVLANLDSAKHQVFVATLFNKDNPIRRLMKSHRIELALPLKQAGITGCLCVGERMTGHYTTRDMLVLGTIADELIIAIQNTLSIQEVKEINETLQQRIANATRELRSSNHKLRELDAAKDEFISMASHQLRTPLTGVKGYISMVLEGDVGKITDEQRKFLEEAFMSSERMVHLISDFLSISRIQTGKFMIEKRPIDLSKIVEQEIDGLKPSAMSRNLKLVYNHPKNFPIIEVDEDKIRQVIMNFSDNAIYYSHDDSDIHIDLVVEGNDIVFTVKDTGIGVPAAERDHLFSKFFRATNARKQRPDGTGVGLFLAKKVIDAQGGEIIFKSVEGRGSTFGFRLPLGKKD